jgi:excisionase family DNA binding protein
MDTNGMTHTPPPPGTNATPALLTTDEVSRLLRLPRSTVTRYAREGRLVAYKPGRSWRFPAAEIRPFLESTRPRR